MGSMPVIGGRKTSSPLRFLVQIGIVAVVCYAAWHAALSFGRTYEFFDMKIYHGAVVWWTQGGELYEFVAPRTTLGFTYPPFAALTMLPMAAFLSLDAGWINVVFGLITLTLVCIALLGPLARRMNWSRWMTVAIAVPMFAAIEPVRESLGYGQVNVLLFGLVIADLIALRHGWRWAGIGIGLATAIKLTPALFIIYLLISKQWRTALVAAATAAAVTVGTHLVVPNESATYWGSILWQTERVGAADMTPNQSLAGLLARLHDTTHAPGLLWISFLLFLLAIGMIRAKAAHADGDELTAFTLVGLTANVISPISWTHHLVWVIPAIIALADQAIRRRHASSGLMSRARSTPGLREPIWFPALTGARHAAAAAGLYLLFLMSPIWPFEHQLPAGSHYADGLFGVLAENSFAIALIVLVVVLPARPGAEPAFGPRQAARVAATAPLRPQVRPIGHVRQLGTVRAAARDKAEIAK
jgi:alpha-1,2-mannosyltransferase